MKNKKLHNIKKTGFKTPNNYFESIEDGVFEQLKDDPSLKDIKDTGYETPDTYFETIEDSIMNKLNEAVSLDKIQASGFKTPDRYFKEVENKVLSRLNDDKVAKVIPLFSKRNILYISSIAAVIMLMFGIFYNKTDNEFDILDLEVVETYLEDQDIDSYDIASLLTEEDLSQDDFGIINDSFSEESLEDYLIDNANLEDIIEQ